MQLPRRRWLPITAGLSVVVAVVVLWPDPPPRPCRATFEKVRLGMTREEVNATVGGQPYRTWIGDPTPEYYEWWRSSDADLLLMFGDDGRVALTQLDPLPQRSFWAKARRQVRF